MKIKYRPHHFLCTLGFKGKGYSPKFVKNYAKIVQHLNSPNGNSTLIEVVDNADDLCKPCPHRQGVLCDKQTVITKLDQHHAKILQIRPGDKITWQEAKQKLRDNMTIENFNLACSGCSWKHYGMCEEALRNLHAEEITTDKNISFKSSPNKNG